MKTGDPPWDKAGSLCYQRRHSIILNPALLTWRFCSCGDSPGLLPGKARSPDHRFIVLYTTELEDMSAWLGCHKAPDLFRQTLGRGLETGSVSQTVSVQGLGGGRLRPMKQLSKVSTVGASCPGPKRRARGHSHQYAANSKGG